MKKPLGMGGRITLASALSLTLLVAQCNPPKDPSNPPATTGPVKNPPRDTRQTPPSTVLYVADPATPAAPSCSRCCRAGWRTPHPGC